MRKTKTDRERAYSSSAWQKIRVQVLERDAYLCQIRGPKCKGRATTVDHITPTASGGEMFALDNLRGACSACNASRGAVLTNQERAAALRAQRGELPARGTTWESIVAAAEKGLKCSRRPHPVGDALCPECGYPGRWLV